MFDDFESALDEKPGTRWHFGLDLGLLILRLVLGGTLVALGLSNFGLFDGPGIEGTAQGLENVFGFTQQTTVLAWAIAIAEVGGGAMLVLGLFTPLGASVALAVAGTLVYLKWGTGFFMDGDGGYQYQLMLGAAALALLFTGPGRIAVDVNTPWRRNPVPYGLVGLLLAAGASAVLLLLFR